jgi:two-component system C4-dicarboxylate transport sensor histidine kinase DctB
VTIPGPAAATPEMLRAAFRYVMARHEQPYLSELTLSLLHKFNNVITGVVFLTEDGMNAAAAGEPMAERLEEIALTLRQSLDSIRQIERLNLNEEQDDTSYYALESIVEDELPLLRMLLPKGTQVHFPHGREPTCFYGSRRSVEEILLHLVGNAGEALAEKSSAIWLSIGKDDDHSTLTLRDHGPGFSEPMREQLFEPFATTKAAQGHAGLGLFRARELARQMRGELTAGNHPEGGAELTLTLPQSNPDSAT